MPGMSAATLALVGDRSPTVRAHGAHPAAHRRAPPPRRARARPVLDPSTEADDLERFDGIWVVPGSPYADREKVIAAVGPRASTASRSWARAAASSTRSSTSPASWRGSRTPTTRNTATEDRHVVVPLECSLVGHEGVIRYTPGTLIARIAGVDQRLERYHCSYGIAPAFVERLEQAGVIFGAHDEDGAPRALELAGHDFFLGTLFQPELAGDGTRAHPVIRAFAEAVVRPPRAWKKYSGIAARVTRDAQLRLQPAEERSSSVTTPATEPPLTTTSRRTPWRTIRCVASSTSMSGSARITGEEACSAARSVCGRACATTDSTMSRSVMKPTGRPSPGRARRSRRCAHASAPRPRAPTRPGWR